MSECSHVVLDAVYIVAGEPHQSVGGDAAPLGSGECPGVRRGEKD